MSATIRLLQLVIFSLQVTALLFTERLGLRAAFDLLVMSILLSNFLYPLMIARAETEGGREVERDREPRRRRADIGRGPGTTP